MERRPPSWRIPRTQVDMMLHGEQQINLAVRRSNLAKGLQALGGLTKPQITLVSNQLANHAEIYDTPVEDTNVARLNAIDLINMIGMPFQTSAGVVRGMRGVSETIMPEVMQHMVSIAEGQRFMHQHDKKPVTINVGSDLDVRVAYMGSDWEGIGGVYVWARDKKSHGYVPLYVIRGNPLVENGNPHFEIHSLQAWISTQMPDMSNIVRIARGNPNNPTMAKMLTVAREHNRLVDRIIRMTKADSTMNREDLILLVATAYLKGVGIQDIRGIAHEYQPALAGRQTSEDIGVMPFNYDGLFGRWFERDESNSAFPWKVSVIGQGQYIRHYDEVPIETKGLLESIFQGTYR